MPKLLLCMYISLTLICMAPSARGDESASSGGLSAPFDESLKYPFNMAGSIKCGRWGTGSQDYPYFGAPRNGGARKHAGVDLYPASGAGTRIKALKSGVVVRIAPFYKRANGEVTYAVLVDHGDFVANYAELAKPVITLKSSVGKGEVLGRVSGTRQLHFELYAKGAESWTRGWYGQRPDNLIDPTQLMLQLYKSSR